MAKVFGTGVRKTVAKMAELTVAKIGETGVRETLAKMGETHCSKNGWSSSWQKWVGMVLETPWQKWLELTVAKKGGCQYDEDGDPWWSLTYFWGLESLFF